MARIYPVYEETETGWTEWIAPLHKGFLFKCCDCGLVHEMQFRVIEDSGEPELDTVAEAPGAVIFRARRKDKMNYCPGTPDPQWPARHVRHTRFQDDTVRPTRRCYDCGSIVSVNKDGGLRLHRAVQQVGQKPIAPR